MKDTPDDVAAQEGSGDDVYHPLYRHDDEEDDFGSADVEEIDHYGGNSEDTKYFSNNDIVDVDEEIDPSDVDFDFNEEGEHPVTNAHDKDAILSTLTPPKVAQAELVTGFLVIERTTFKLGLELIIDPLTARQGCALSFIVLRFFKCVNCQVF